MKYIFSILLTCMFLICGYAQTASKKISETEKFKISADSLFRNKNYDGAIKMYSELLKVNSKEQTSLFMRGMSYFINKDNNNAINDFSSVIEIDENNSSAYYFRALSKFNISSENEIYSAENKSSICDDLFMAKKLGYPTDYTNFKIVCPNL